MLNWTKTVHACAILSKSSMSRAATFLVILHLLVTLARSEVDSESVLSQKSSSSSYAGQ